MFRKTLIALPALLLGLTLVACDGTSSSTSGSFDSSDDSSSQTTESSQSDFTQGSYPFDISQPSVTDPQGTVNEVGQMKATTSTNALPQSGEANILVVPVHFSGSSDTAWTSSQIAAVNDLFFGDGELSVANYYSTSSYGKLSLSGVTGPATNGLTLELSLEDYTALVSTYGLSDTIARITDWVVQQIFVSDLTRTLDWHDFDADDDGRIDMIQLVFPEAPYDGSTVTNTLQAPSIYFDVEGDESGLDVGCVAWAPYYYVSTRPGLFYNMVGQALGIERTDDVTGDADSVYRAPMGNTDVMDSYVVTDQSSFAKFSMGWIEPDQYTAEDIPDDGLTITLSPFESSGECVLLSYEKQDDSFGEYLLLDFFTPTGLNSEDLSTVFTQGGIRVLKVDSRLAVEQGGRWYEYSGDYNFTDGTGYDYAYTNSGTNDYYSYGITANYPLVTFLDSSNFNRHMTDYSLQLTSDDLFQEGEGFGTSGHSWDTYVNFEFDGDGYNGPKLGITFTVDEVTSTSCTITLRRA